MISLLSLLGNPFDTIHTHQNGRVFEITKEEVYAFYGIYLFMGLVGLPAYRDYWRKGSHGEAFVRNVISRDPFEEILRNLHFSNNLHENPKSDNGWKVKNLIEHFNYVYQRFACDISHASVDEHICKFKGKSSISKTSQFRGASNSGSDVTEERDTCTNSSFILYYIILYYITGKKE